MTQDSIFRLMTLLLFVGAFSISGYFRRKAEREGGRMKSPEGSGLVIVLRLLGLLVVLPLLGYLINPDWVAWARMPLPAWARWIAAAAAVSTLPMFYWILTSIGRNITATQGTRVDHQLVTHGPYRWIRHPLYSIGFIFAVALMLMTSLWTGVAMVVPLAVLLWRTSKEEARLVETFGDAYRDYMQRTGRFLPRPASLWGTPNQGKEKATP